METILLVLRILGAWFIIVPISVFLHELAHAVVILVLTQHPVKILIGSRGTPYTFQLGRLSIIVSPGFDVIFQATDCDAQLTPPVRMLFHLAGPISSLVCTILFGSLWWWTNYAYPWGTFALVCFILFIVTAFPWTYPKGLGVISDNQSDVLQAWRLFQHMRQSDEM